MATSSEISITNDDIVKELRAAPFLQVVNKLLEQIPAASMGTLHKKIKQVDEKFKKLRKSKHREAGKIAMENFLKEKFIVPIQREVPEEAETERRPHSVTLEGEMARLETPTGKDILQSTLTSELRLKEARIKELEEQVQKMKGDLESKERMITALQERVETKNIKIHRLRESDRYY